MKAKHCSHCHAAFHWQHSCVSGVVYRYVIIMPTAAHQIWLKHFY